MGHKRDTGTGKRNKTQTLLRRQGRVRKEHKDEGTRGRERDLTCWETWTHKIGSRKHGITHKEGNKTTSTINTDAQGRTQRTKTQGEPKCTKANLE